MTAKSKDIAVPEAPKSLLPIPASDIKAIMESALAPGERLDVLSLPTIKVPAGGGRTWDLPDGSSAQELTGIAVVRRPVRAYWSAPFEGGGTPPDCSSLDAMTGTGTPGGKCETCDMAQFGSGKDQSQACRLITRLFLLQEGNILPTLLPLPPSAFKACQSYVIGLTARGMALWHVRTAITLKTEKSTGGITYSMPEFKVAGVLTPEERAEMNGYRASFLPIVETMAVTEEV